MKINNICVFCGSGVGANNAYREGAELLGKTMVAHKIGLVFGGGSVGLMGVISDAVLAAGGRAIGVIPTALDRREIKHERLTEIHIVNTMHERKALMNDLSDAFIAMPGGFGTFDELFEAITWAQLGIHRKPIAIYNIAGYFDPLLAMVNHALNEKFIPEFSRPLLLIGDTPQTVLTQIMVFEPDAYHPKWDGLKP